MGKELLFSLTKKDFRVETFRAGGKGGQHQNKTSSGVRITHIESGAVGESREERSQLQNKKRAFERLIKTKEFQNWHRLKCAVMMQGHREIEQMINQKVEEALKPENLLVEIRVGNVWRREEDIGGEN